jgi:hypothetical protein
VQNAWPKPFCWAKWPCFDFSVQGHITAQPWKTSYLEPLTYRYSSLPPKYAPV